jgi:hypothetical protein
MGGEKHFHGVLGRKFGRHLLKTHSCCWIKITEGVCLLGFGDQIPRKARISSEHSSRQIDRI